MSGSLWDCIQTNNKQPMSKGQHEWCDNAISGSPSLMFANIAMVLVTIVGILQNNKS